MLWQVLMGANLTEAEVKAEIDRAMIENGSNPDWPSFGTIVAAGENGAIPHGDPVNDGAGPRVILPGDVVVVDLGARVNDWVSDVTRSYVVGGTTNATIIKAYMAVHDAQNLTFPLIEAGTPAWALDDIARTHIEEEGFGEYFIHSLGHGFGVCVHEPPLLSSGTDDPLFGLSYNQQPLMAYDAVTIEPGIYIDGWFGIRIEDDFLVNTDGHEFMTADLPRDLDWFMIKRTTTTLGMRGQIRIKNQTMMTRLYQCQSVCLKSSLSLVLLFGNGVKKMWVLLRHPMMDCERTTHFAPYLRA